MELIRRPTKKEERIIELLIENASMSFPISWKEGLYVRKMEDGGMGSLYLFENGDTNANRILGKQVSEIQFADQDGVIVIASLNVDDKGKLLELDIWKTDFSTLIEFPDI